MPGAASDDTVVAGAADDTGFLDDGTDDGKGGAPDAYADFKIPDGMQVDAELLASAKDMFKGLGFSQEQGQGFVTWYAERMQDRSEAANTAMQETQSSWVKEMRSDPVLGGENWDASKALIQGAIGWLNANAPEPEEGTPPFGTQIVKAFTDVGLKNFVPFNRLLHLIGKQTAEDTHHGGSGEGGEPGSGKENWRKSYPDEEAMRRGRGGAAA